MTGAASPRIEAFEAKIAVSARHRLAGYPRRAFAALERAPARAWVDASGRLGMHWPAFNLADIFIVGSAALLVLAAFRPGANGQRTGQGSTG